MIVLVALLSVGWVTDFREAGNRSHAYNWPKISATWLSDCAKSTTGSIYNVAVFGNHSSTLPCERLNR